MRILGSNKNGTTLTLGNVVFTDSFAAVRGGDVSVSAVAAVNRTPSSALVCVFVCLCVCVCDRLCPRPFFPSSLRFVRSPKSTPPPPIPPSETQRHFMSVFNVTSHRGTAGDEGGSMFIEFADNVEVGGFDLFEMLRVCLFSPVHINLILCFSRMDKTSPA